MCNSVRLLLEAGLALVPVPAGQKHPLTPRWNEREQAVTELSHAHRLDGFNIGLAHAFCQPVPTCAIDIDEYIGANTWLRSKGVDLAGLVSAAGSVVSTSQRKGRLKLFYTLPRDVPPLRGFKVTSADRQTTLLEFRCASKAGKTELDILPPSIHPDTGKPYIWVGQSDPTRMPVMPTDVLNLWREELRERHERNSVTGGGLRSCCNPETPAEVARLRERLKFIDADCDYETYRNVVWAILGTGWSCAEALAEEWCQTAPDRYEDESFRLVFDSFDPDVDPRPTLGTIVFLARQGGWRG